MRPACPKCDSGSTRRNRRSASLKHKLMYLLGRFPWECLTCEKRFFNSMRYARSSRSQHGEVYFRLTDPGQGREPEQLPVPGRTASQPQSQTSFNFEVHNPGPSRHRG